MDLRRSGGLLQSERCLRSDLNGLRSRCWKSGEVDARFDFVGLEKALEFGEEDARCLFECVRKSGVAAWLFAVSAFSGLASLRHGTGEVPAHWSTQAAWPAGPNARRLDG